MTNMTIARQRFGKHRLKPAIVEPERTSIAEQRLGTHVPAATDTLVKSQGVTDWHTFSWQRIRQNDNQLFEVVISSRFSRSRRRRRKGKSQNWESKIWSQVPRDSDSRKTALARASNTYKTQTRPLVREGAPLEQDRNCHTCNKDLVVSPRWVLYSKTDWPADRRS
jgi:hypothetical protein